MRVKMEAGGIGQAGRREGMIVYGWEVKAERLSEGRMAKPIIHPSIHPSIHLNTDIGV